MVIHFPILAPRCLASPSDSLYRHNWHLKGASAGPQEIAAFCNTILFFKNPHLDISQSLPNVCISQVSNILQFLQFQISGLFSLRECQTLFRSTPLCQIITWKCTLLHVWLGEKPLSLAASLWILSCQLSLLTSSSWKAQPVSPFQITYLTFPVNPLAGYLSYRSQANHSFHLPISVIETKILYSQLLRHTSYSFPLCPVFRRLLRSWLILHIHNSLSTHPIFRISSHSSSPTLFLKALVLGEFILADSLNIWLSYIPKDWS